MLPIYLKLEGRPCLVVGAGTIAAPKIESLSECRNTDCSLFFKREQIKEHKDHTEHIAGRIRRKPVEIVYE